MKGAREYASYFKTGQYGRLYIVSGSHARGSTFSIYVLPDESVAESNGSNNHPLNGGRVEVYGMTSGQRGWTETYGWLHKGKWQDDFKMLFDEAQAHRMNDKFDSDKAKEKRKAEENSRVNSVLSSY